MPRNIIVDRVVINGASMVCKVSDPSNPRPLVPKSKRDLIVNLTYPLDYLGVKESTRRVPKDC